METGSPRYKKLFDDTRSAKLKNSLEKIPHRILKENHERIRGIMFAALRVRVRATIKRVDGIMKRKPREAFDRWRKNVVEVNNNEILDGIRTPKLLKALSRVPVRVISDATQRILGEGNKVKGAIK